MKNVFVGPFTRTFSAHFSVRKLEGEQCVYMFEIREINVNTLIYTDL